MIAGRFVSLDAELIRSDPNVQIALSAAELLDAVVVAAQSAGNGADYGGANHDGGERPLTFADYRYGSQQTRENAGDDGADDAVVVAGTKTETSCQSE